MTTETLPCKVLLGEVRGAEVNELVERVSGGTCPCRLGQPCPLLPRESSQLQPLPYPLHRVE